MATNSNATTSPAFISLQQTYKIALISIFTSFLPYCMSKFVQIAQIKIYEIWQITQNSP
jgi:hypothetical protein